MTNLVALIEAYQRCIKSNRNVVSKLKNKIEEIEDFKVKCAAAKTVGTIAGVVGGIGLLAAPFTGGLSALVTGVVGSVAGIATNTITDWINSSETKDFINELEDFNKSRSVDTEKLANHLNELSKHVQDYRQDGHGEEEAFTYAVMKMSGRDPRRLIKRRKFGDSVNSSTVEILLKSGSMATKVYLTNLLVVRALTASLGIKGFSFIENAIKTSSSAALKGAGTGLRIFASVATVAIIVIDVALLIKEWTDDNPAASHGSKLIEQLKEEVQCYENMLKELENMKKKIDDCSSDSSSDEECTCYPVELSVFYVNIQSMRPNLTDREKVTKFRQYISEKDPDIVVVVETWLTSDISTATIQNNWNLFAYDLSYRYDRSTSTDPNEAERRGGGILVGYKRGKLSQLHFDFHEDLEWYSTCPNSIKDSLRFFTISKYFNCGECKKVGLIPGSGLRTYSLVVFYRRPAPFGQSFTQAGEDWENYKHQNAESITYLLEFFQGRGGFLNFLRSAGVIVGDFNWTTREWNNYIGNIPELFRVPTTGNTYRGKTCPDGVIAVPLEFVPGPIPILDCGTEHKALFFKLQFGQDYDDKDPCKECFT